MRRAHAMDLPRLMALLQRVVPLMRADGNMQWDEKYPNEKVFTRDIELGQLWVAEQGDGVLAGVIAITTDQPPEYAQAGWDIRQPAIVPHRLAVDPAYRGTGIASALMQQAEVTARERGIPLLRVDTGAQNVVVQRMFLKLGYTLAGETSFRGGLRFLCYQKRLDRVAK